MSYTWNAGPMSCPECGEPAEYGTPTDLISAQLWRPTRPIWRHLDGTPLCPVIGENGYQSADAIPAASAIDPSSPTEHDTVA